MSKANEYRIYAEECLGWARSAVDEEKRQQFLAMASTWMKAAMMQEQREAPAPTVPVRPTNGDARDVC